MNADTSCLTLLNLTKEQLVEKIQELTKENEELTKSFDDLEEEHQELKDKYEKPFRVYLGEKAYKVDLPCDEEFFETLDDAKKYIDEINKDGGSIKVSYDSIDYLWYD